MRILVTGGSGRLGQSVVRTLVARGHDVLDASLEPSPPGATASLAVDVLDLGAVRGAIAAIDAEAIVHLAALAIPFSHPEEDLFRTNALGTFHVFRAALGAGTRTVVYVGSPYALGYGAPGGWRPEYLPIDEAHPLAPWNAYGLSKAVGEETMRSFIRQSGGRLRAFGVRPCFVVAPEEWTGEREIQGGGTIRDRLDDPAAAARSLFNYVDARDASELFALVAERADEVPIGEIFFAGAADALAREPLSELIPRFYPGTEELAAGLTGSAPAFSIGKARGLLGWEPRHSWRTELESLEA